MTRPVHLLPVPRPARRLHLGGRVQGVGFRPFVWHLARRLSVDGWVENRAGEVIIHAEGEAGALARFRRALLEEAPPAARPRLLADEPAAPAGRAGFAIRPSRTGQAREAVTIPPDRAPCRDCRRELHDPRDRRFRYPFLNCTQCGPRYTLLRELPWDRARTTMAGFPLCPDCAREYTDPGDRRFHAEPVACPACGPRLAYRGGRRAVTETPAALAAALETLRRGHVLAVRGVGGYHLMCDARNATAVTRLRRRKCRPHKPLAVLLPRALAAGLPFTPETAEALRGPVAPIMLVPAAALAPLGLAPAVAPGLAEVGLMLPCSPLHELLAEAFGGPLVTTSGNVSGEPMLTEPDEAEARLGAVADAFLHHDRPIVRPADDPVYRPVAGTLRPLRLGRGNAPLELELPFRLQAPLLAVGGHMKNTVALAWDRRVVVSPHVGDLDHPRSLALFRRLVEELQDLYRVRVRRVACDAHPGYASHRWARGSGLPLHRVWHHHAHAAAVAGEFPREARWLVFTWDGVGLGEDGTLWGGEALLGTTGRWRRVASLRPFRLPGGERAARAPWRSALGLCWEASRPWPGAPDLDPLLRRAWERGMNSPVTTAAGRLFDAAAALLGLVHETSYEGQGPMELEALAAGADVAAPVPPLPMAEDASGVLRCDWAPLLDLLLDGARPAAERAAAFHAVLAESVAEMARRLRRLHGDFAVGLAGGVFQNRLLAEQALAGLQAAGFRAYLPARVPVNDAGLCFGQVIAAGSAGP